MISNLFENTEFSFPSNSLPKWPYLSRYATLGEEPCVTRYSSNMGDKPFNNSKSTYGNSGGVLKVKLVLCAVNHLVMKTAQCILLNYDLLLDERQLHVQ